MAESEAETPSTPCEFESKYFEYNGVRLPPFCRGKMEEIANFPVRDSDVWIVTYPKSGGRGEACTPPPAVSAARDRPSDRRPTEALRVEWTASPGSQARVGCPSPWEYPPHLETQAGARGCRCWSRCPLSVLRGDKGAAPGKGNTAREEMRLENLILICFVPITGRRFHCTGLLQEVVYLVSQGADPDEIGLMNIDEQLPVLEYPQPGLDIIKELTSPRLIKSHLPYRFLPSDLHNGNSKVIYMARNPKDLVVSYYQFHRSLRTMSYRGTFQEFCRRFMNDKLGYGSWFEHVQEFWEHHMDANVLFLKYEDMHKDLATMVEQLVRFLGVSYDKAQLESMVEHCHQLIDQCCNAEALPVGRAH
ncbi:sulfotransferase 4A1 isoform X2 [Heliangelus exortis]